MLIRDVDKHSYQEAVLQGKSPKHHLEDKTPAAHCTTSSDRLLNHAAPGIIHGGTGPADSISCPSNSDRPVIYLRVWCVEDRKLTPNVSDSYLLSAPLIWLHSQDAYRSGDLQAQLG